MKKSLLKRVAAWTAAVALLLSPAGADLVGVTALAVESISVNENSENIDGENKENNNENNNENDDENDNENNNENDDENDNENNNENDENNGDNNDENNNDENTDNDENSENNNDDENNDENEDEAENNDENDEEDSEFNELSCVEHYVSPISGEGLLPYEYYYLGEIEADEDDDSESFFEASSYNEALSNYSSKDGYNALSSTLQEVYDNAYSALVAIDSSADYDATKDSKYDGYYFDRMLVSDTVVGSDDLFKVYIALKDDNPQFFWVGHKYLHSTSGTKTYIHFGVDDYCSDCYDGDTRMNLKEQVMAEIEEVVDGAATYSNEYSKEWYIHNYLCEKTTYVDGEHAHDISGILVGGEAVCESYAKCFQLFMNALDIDVLYVSGTGNGGGHAWNQVGLDNNGSTEWYNVDVTWDDSSTSYDYNYFNVVDSAGGYYDFTNGYNGHNEHTPLTTSDREYLYPVNKCTSTTYSYDNHDANYEEASGDPVAQIGSKTFKTLGAAIKSIKSAGQTITLLSDVTYSGTDMPSYSFIINGGGKYSITFRKDMELKADLTLKGIAGIDRSDYDYSVLPKAITIGTHTLTISKVYGDYDYIPVSIIGSKDANKGSVIIEGRNASVFSIENVENLTVKEGLTLTVASGASGTNLTLEKNATIVNSYYIDDSTYYSDSVCFTKLYSAVGAVLKIDLYTAYNYYYFKNIDEKGLTLTVDEYLEGDFGGFGVIDYAPLLLGTKLSVDNIIVDGKANFVALSREKNSEGNYMYFLSNCYDFSINDGEKTVKRVTFNEAVEYISENNKANADYIIGNANRFASIVHADAEGALFNSIKAKSVTFDSNVEVNITSDFSPKCDFTFNSIGEVTFDGKVNAGTHKITLGSGDYRFNNAVTSTSAITVNKGKVTFAGSANNKTITHSVKELSVENGGTVIYDGGIAKITSALKLTDSSIYAANGAKIDIASISAAGENNVINSYNNSVVTVTGNVALTDNKPIALSCFAPNDYNQNNVVSSGQTAIIVKNSKVTVDMFKTSAKTSGGIEATLTKVGNEIRYATAAFMCDGNSYSQWSDVINYINNNPDSAKTFEIKILDDVTVDELTLPAAAKAKGIALRGGINTADEYNSEMYSMEERYGDGSFVPPESIRTIKIKNKTLKATVDIAVYYDVVLEMSSDKKSAVTVSAGKNIDVGGKLINAGNITGTKTSSLIANGSIEAVSISTFNSVEGNITVSGTVTGVKFDGATVKMLPGSNVTAITGDTSVLFQLVQKEGTALPKLTLSSVGKNTSVCVIDETDEVVGLASGTIVAYSSKEPANPITIMNKTSSEKELSAVYYSSSKNIKAEYTGTLTLSDGEKKIDDFSSIELVFEKITKLNKKTSDYLITLNEDVSAVAFKLPSAANSISFTADGQKNINLTNVTAISLPVNVSFTNIKMESTKPFTMTASKNLTLEHFNSDTVKQIKGGAKSTLSLNGENISLPIASFGKVIVENGSSLVPKSSIAFTDLNLMKNATLRINDGVNVTIKNIKGETDSLIIYESAFYTPFTVSGKAEGTVNVGINGVKFNENQLAFKASSADLSCFIIDNGSLPDGEFAFSRTKSDVYVKRVKFELTVIYDNFHNTVNPIFKMAEWSDIVSSINAANDKTVDYTVTLLDEYYVMYSAMTMPKKDTYASLTINSKAEEPSEIDFLGTSLTLTGDTTFENIGLYGLKKSGKSYVYSYYKINAGKYALTLDNVKALINGITSSGELNIDSSYILGNVTAGGGKFHSVLIEGNVTVKGMLSISGVNTYCGTLSVGGIEAVDTETYDAEIDMIYGKKFTVGKNGIGKDGTINVRFYDVKSDKYKALNSGDKVADITGDYYGNVVLDEQDDFKVVRSGNKLVCVDEGNTSIYGLSINNSDAEYTYISLKDLIADINRMNDPKATYKIKIYKDESIKGSLPVPTAKKYSEISYVTENDAEIIVTGDIKLTGDLDITAANIKKVNNKGIEQVMNYNIGAYTLGLNDVDTIGSINGAKGRVNLYSVKEILVTGNVNVAEFVNAGDSVIEIKLGSKASFTATSFRGMAFRGMAGVTIDMPYSIASKVKIGSADYVSFNILDASGKTLKIDESYAGKALIGQCKGSLANISLKNELPEGYVLATGKSSMLTIGKPVCSVVNKQFASIGDAINSGDNVTIVLLDDITMTEALTIPEGKSITIQGEEKTIKLKGTILVNGNLTFDDLNVVDTSSKLGTSYKLGKQGNLNFISMNDVNINTVTSNKLDDGCGIIGLTGVENAYFNGSVKCRTITADDSSSNIKLVKGKSVQLDEFIDGNVTLVDKNGKSVTIKEGDSVYKLTKAPDSIGTILNNVDTNGNQHTLVYSKGYVKVGKAK